MNILYLEKRGCDFSPNDERVKASDVGNYRVTTPGYTVPGKSGRTYCLEIIRSDKWNYRRTHKITGRTLKHTKRELVSTCAAGLTGACYIDETDGCCYGDLNLWRESDTNTRPYTLAGILDLVNSFAAIHYDAIEFVA